MEMIAIELAHTDMVIDKKTRFDPSYFSGRWLREGTPRTKVTSSKSLIIY